MAVYVAMCACGTSAHHEYLLYQTLVGTWPGDAKAREPDYADRMVAYLQKAAREGKEQSSWFSPDPTYEAALERFVRGILESGANNPFPEDLARFVAPLIPFGQWNSLSQSALQLTVPGMPDIYQGTELETLTLVDPDNRRPVDYEKRQQALARLQAIADPRERWVAVTTDHAGDSLKLHLIQTVLNLRRQDPELFQRGSYMPLTVMGPAADHVCAFARLWEGRAAVVLAPRLLHTLCAGDATRLTSALWTDTQLKTEAALPAGPWRDLLTGELWPALAEGDLAGVFTQAPLALLVSGG